MSTWRRPAKTLRHPGLGEMTFTNDIVAVQGAPELTLVSMAPGEPERFSAAPAARA